MDLSEVVQALAPLEDKYYELGVQLKLKPELLKSIERDHSNTSRRLHETVDLWQRNVDNSECCWSTLAGAVENMRVYPKLADELRKREHCIVAIPNKKRRSDHAALVVSELIEHQQELNSTENSDDKGYGSMNDSPRSETESYFNLVPGCGCGKCSIFTVGVGKCPHPSAKKVPILTRRRSQSATCTHSEIPIDMMEDDDNYIEVYEKKTREIQQEFGKYVTKACRSLKDKGVGIHELALFIESSFPMMKEVSDKLDEATCTEQVFRIAVKQACSWFDYELVKDVMDFFGDSNDKELLTKDYEKKFKEYAEERKLPNGKKYIQVGSGARIGGKQLVVKIDKVWDQVSFNDLNNVRDRFASILGVRRRDLYLAGIQEGCIMMTFMITEELAGILFPKKNSTSFKLLNHFTLSQVKSLKDEGIISVTYGKLSWQANNTEQKEVEL